MSTLLRVVVAAAVITVVVGAPPAPDVPLAELDRPIAVAQPVPAPQSIDELRARIGEVLDREGVPGAGIALVGRDGPIWVGGVGVTDLETKTPVDADTVFRVASITKTIVALGVMKLVEAKRLDLDQPIADLVPDAGIDNAWNASAPVTLAMVLEHTAGFDDMHWNELYSDDDALPASAALAINRAARVCRWQPGTRSSYSNVGYTLAGRAIEVATGEPFDTWLRREVLAPLGMHGDFRRTAVLSAHLATGYVARGRAAPFFPIAHRPAGALLASPADLAKLVQMFIARSPVVVSPAGLARMERPATLPYPHADAEYGLAIAGDVSQPALGRGHDGGITGFVSAYRYFPDLDAGYVMLLNATHSPRAYLEIRALLYAYLARGRTVAPPVATRGEPEADFYAFASPRAQLVGFIDRAIFGWHVAPSERGVAMQSLLGDRFELVRTADGAYRAPAHSGTSLVFTHARDGSPVMIAAGAYCEPGSWTFARARLRALQIALTLVELSPLWALGALVFAAMQRRRPAAIDLLLAPAVACIAIRVVPWLLFESSVRGELGTCNAWTIGVFLATIAVGLAGIAGAVAVVRWSVRPDRPALTSRLLPSAMCLATAGLAAWLAAHGLVGLRPWAW